MNQDAPIPPKFTFKDKQVEGSLEYVLFNYALRIAVGDYRRRWGKYVAEQGSFAESPTLKDGILCIERNKWLQPIAESYPELEDKFEKVRTKNYASINAKTAAFATVHDLWLRRPDSNRRPID